MSSFLSRITDAIKRPQDGCPARHTSIQTRYLIDIVYHFNRIDADLRYYYEDCKDLRNSVAQKTLEIADLHDELEKSLQEIYHLRINFTNELNLVGKLAEENAALKTENAMLKGVI